MESSRVTNILLAIIAVCLLALVLRPMGVVPGVSAQELPAAKTGADRFTELTAADKTGQLQATATQAVATSIDGLAAAVREVAKSIDSVGQVLGAGGGGKAAASEGGVIVPEPPAPPAGTAPGAATP